VLEFIELPVFTRRLATLAGGRADDVLLEIQSDLLENPTRGKIVEGTGGVRKARAADPARGKGKRGGFRYLYYFIERDAQVFLLMIFSKGEQDDLTKEQKRALRNAVSGLLGEADG
jgi:hypothetical protein